MTIRKQWVIMLSLMSIIAITIVSLVLSVLINKDYNNIIEDKYNQHVTQVIDYVNEALSENRSMTELRVVLDSHIISPITGIKLYQNDELIISLSNRTMMGMGRMNNQQSQVYRIEDQKVIVVVEREVPVNQWFMSTEFRKILMRNILISTLLTLFMSLIIGLQISKKTSKHLKLVAVYAKEIDTGGKVHITVDKIEEIAVIQKALMSLNKKLKLKQRFQKNKIEEVIHQTKTPLAIINSHIEGIRDGVLELDGKRLENMTYQVSNLEAVLNKFRTIYEFKDATTYSEFLIHEVLNDVSAGFLLQCEQKNLDFNREFEPCLITTDQYKLSQVVYNLLSNAVFFTKEGHVSIKGYNNVDSYNIIIEDSGIGMKNTEEVFEPYYKEKSNGEGLGLYIVNNLLMELNAQIKVESKEDIGTKICLELSLKK